MAKQAPTLGDAGRFLKILKRFERLKQVLMDEGNSVWIEPDIDLSHETKLVLRIDIYVPKNDLSK